MDKLINNLIQQRIQQQKQQIISQSFPQYDQLNNQYEDLQRNLLNQCGINNETIDLYNQVKFFESLFG